MWNPSIVLCFDNLPRMRPWAVWAREFSDIKSAFIPEILQIRDERLGCLRQIWRGPTEGEPPIIGRLSLSNEGRTDIFDVQFNSENGRAIATSFILAVIVELIFV